MKPDLGANDLSFVLQVTAAHARYDETLIVRILREFAASPLPAPEAAP